MLPKNSKHYIIPAAEELNVDSEIVEDLVSFYYSEVRKALTSLKSNNIMVEELGTFAFKRKELSKLKVKYENHLNKLNVDTYAHRPIIEKVTKSLNDVAAAISFLEEEKERKTNFLKEKHGKKR